MKIRHSHSYGRRTRQFGAGFDFGWERTGFDLSVCLLLWYFGMEVWWAE